ncbi:MAG: hypothetical protein HN353_02325 [Bdellovibrionales bacterium]|nr:hypothetical protein [Bdellovibrionales bacterium]MBT3525522.1 hypothetical protein [Bdellovibrionales bacterium]MBT7766048.1 hypothetical protein [Bdellovibrionales bacterium]
MRRVAITILLLLPPLVASFIVLNSSDQSIIKENKITKGPSLQPESTLAVPAEIESIVKPAVDKRDSRPINRAIIVKKTHQKRVQKVSIKEVQITPQVGKIASFKRKRSSRRKIVPFPLVKKLAAIKIPTRKPTKIEVQNHPTPVVSQPKLREIPERVVIKGHTSTLIDNSELIQHYGYRVGNSKVKNYASSFIKLEVARYLAKLEKQELSDAIRVKAQKLAQQKKNSQKSQVVSVAPDHATNQAAVKDSQPAILEDKVKNTLAATSVVTQVARELPTVFEYSSMDEPIKGGSQIDVENSISSTKTDRVNVGGHGIVVKADVTPTRELSKIVINQGYNPLVAANRQKVSVRVEKVIKREMDSQAAVSTHSGQSSARYAPVIKSSPKLKSGKKMSTQKIERAPAIESDIVVFTLRALSIDPLGKIAPQSLSGHQFEPLYDRNIRFSDHRHNGRVEVTHKLQGETGHIGGRVITERGIVTNISMAVDAGRLDVEIPVFLEEELEQLAGEVGNESVGHLLLDLEDHDIEVMLDAGPVTKFYFDHNFKRTTVDGDYRYLLIVNIPVGNVLVSYQQHNEMTIPRIINIVQNELLFENVQFMSGGPAKIVLQERRLMSDLPFDLNLASNSVALFAMDTKFQKSGLSQFNFYLERHLFGSRNYLEFTHTDEPIFVGMGSNSTLEIPSTQFQKHILSIFNLNTLEESCLVQINPAKEIKSFSVGGTSGRGNLNLSTLYLDIDGVISDTASTLTKKIFLAADEQGVINFRVLYADSSEDLVKTICSIDSYLVEQL